MSRPSAPRALDRVRRRRTRGPPRARPRRTPRPPRSAPRCRAAPPRPRGTCRRPRRRPSARARATGTRACRSCRLARSVHAHDEQDRRLAGEVEARRLPEELRDLVAERLVEVGELATAPRACVRARAVAGTPTSPAISASSSRSQSAVLPGSNAADASSAERLARARQRLAQPAEQAALLLVRHVVRLPVPEQLSPAPCHGATLAAPPCGRIRTLFPVVSGTADRSGKCGALQAKSRFRHGVVTRHVRCLTPKTDVQDRCGGETYEAIAAASSRGRRRDTICETPSVPSSRRRARRRLPSCASDASRR